MGRVVRTINIDYDRWRKLKIVAIENSSSASAIIRRLVDDLLIKEGKIKQDKELL